MKRALLMLFVAGCTACRDQSVDQKKFEAVDHAGQILQTDLIAGGGSPSAHFAVSLDEFQAEIARLDSRTNGRQESAALKSFAAAAEAYRYLLRFQLLERDAVQGMVLLSGSNRPIASRYGFPMENRGGGRWVNRKTAMKMLSESASVALREAHTQLFGV
jgi:hypothetical protein